MAAASLMLPDGSDRPRRKKSPITFGRILAVVAIGLVIAIGYNFLGTQTVSDRPNEMKTTQVILPPPPPPPPPPPETKPIEQPPEPTIAPPIEQPVDTPPPPQANNDPSPGDNALTAREGAGPVYGGLAVGDGSGVRIGGKPGGGGSGGGMSVGMYTSYLKSSLQERVQDDPRLSRLVFSADYSLTVTRDGRITGVTFRNARGGSDADMQKLTALLQEVRGLDPPPQAMVFPQLVTVRGRKSSL
ncbi:TonB-dependent receptor [Sphingobium sp. H39-3-25]|uniref:TonB-dependent receptor n=1 Tax=Sphingobium TaxID=165695 RepID=UPI0023B9D035|nr:TonB-dependent receptor [Sphingobium arseniciresistens]